jgi:hypothetical protein
LNIQPTGLSTINKHHSITTKTLTT